MLLDQQIRMMTNAAFRFVVTVKGVPMGAFTECSLPTIELEVQDVQEGGLNTYTHQLPGRRRPSRVTFRNGVGVMSQMMTWYMQTLQEKFDRHDVTVTLLSGGMVPIIHWHFIDAYPVKWTGPQLRSDDNAIAIQSLELAFGEFMILP